MSWQKCMSFLKCSDLETKNVISFKLRQQRDKGRTIISDKKKFQRESFLDEFYASENQN